MTLPGPVVTVEWLAGNLDEVRVIDCRWYLADLDQGRREYEAGHIPGAVFADLEHELSGTAGAGRHPMPTAGEFETAMRTAGVSNDMAVVAYDQSIGAIAARLWWLLRHFGHDRAAILDGGFAAWQRAGLPTSSIVPTLGLGDFTAQERTDDVLDRDAVVARLGQIRLIDARAPERYRGEVEPVDARPGHIPGAINLPFAGNAADGSLLPPEQLRKRLGDTSSMVVYCGSGVTACHHILAAAHADLPLPLLYDGSWSDWADSDLLAVQGEDQG